MKLTLYSLSTIKTDKQNSNFPVATIVLLLLNTIIQVCFSNSSHGALILPSGLHLGEWFRFITACFVHHDWSHYYANMMFFITFPFVEKKLGIRRFLMLYLLSGFMSYIIFLPLLYRFNMIEFPALLLIGASGAMYGVISALVWLLLEDWQGNNFFSRM